MYQSKNINYQYHLQLKNINKTYPSYRLIGSEPNMIVGNFIENNVHLIYNFYTSSSTYTIFALDYLILL